MRAWFGQMFVSEDTNELAVFEDCVRWKSGPSSMECDIVDAHDRYEDLQVVGWCLGMNQIRTAIRPPIESVSIRHPSTLHIWRLVRSLRGQRPA